MPKRVTDDGNEIMLPDQARYRYARCVEELSICTKVFEKEAVIARKVPGRRKRHQVGGRSSTARKRLELHQTSGYKIVSHIPATTCICERTFSKARLVLTDYRKSMLPLNFECIMFLKLNRTLWTEQIVCDLLAKKSVDDNDVAAEIDEE